MQTHGREFFLEGWRLQLNHKNSAIKESRRGRDENAEMSHMGSSSIPNDHTLVSSISVVR